MSVSLPTRLAGVARLSKPHDGGTPIAVLLTKDEPLVRMVAADVLLEAGYRVIEADDADEALTLLGVRPDVRVLDTNVRMPGTMSGIDLAFIVAKPWPDVGLLVASGHAEPQPGDLPAGAVFIPKPYYPSQLLDAVASLLASQTPEADAISVEDAVIALADHAATEALTPASEPPKAVREKDGEAEG